MTPHPPESQPKTALKEQVVRQYVPGSWTWVCYLKDTRELELTGRFTASKLRRLAYWLDHPKGDIPRMNP